MVEVSHCLAWPHFWRVFFFQFFFRWCLNVPNNTKTASLCSSKTWKSQRMERIDVGKKINCGIQTLNFFVLKNFVFEFNFVLFTVKLGWNGLLLLKNESKSKSFLQIPTLKLIRHIWKTYSINVLDNGNDFAKATTTLQDVKIEEYRLVGVSEWGDS